MIVGLWSDTHNFPSIPLMKLSAYHKDIGDTVEFMEPGKYYDIVYLSKVFTETREPTGVVSDKVIRGGSGYDLENRLPEYVENRYPDYSLY